MKQVSIIDIVILLARRKWIIIIGLFVISVFAVVLSFLLPSYYEAKAVILPAKNGMNSNIGSLLGDLPVGGLLKNIGLFESKDNDQFLSVLSSRRLAERTIREFNLPHVYKFDKKKSYFPEDIIKRFWKNLRVEETDLSNIEITFTDKDTLRSAAVVNFLIAQLDSITYDLSKTNARNSRMFFERRLTEIRKDLDSVQSLFTRFQIEHHYFDIDEQLKSTVRALADAEARVAGTQMQIDLLKSQFKSGSPELVELENNRKVMQQRLDAYMASGSGRLVISLIDAPKLGVTYAHLLRDAKVQELLYTFTLQMYEQAKFQEINNTPVVTILETASVPHKKSRPKRSIICILSFMIGFVVLSIAVLLEQWFQAQRSANSEIYAKIRTLGKEIGLRI